MTGEWDEVTVGDIAAPIRNALVGGPFGSNLVSRDYVVAGVPVIRGQNMGERWVSGDFVFVSGKKARALEANLARPDDIVFTQRGTLGQVSLIPDAAFDRYLVSQSQMKLTVNRDLADPLFIYYVFSTAEQQDYIRQNAIQTGVPHTNLGILRNTPVPLPPLPEQRAIACILGALDDKIELNRRMNRTLEAMARAIFQSWFVDFDPVRAKLAPRGAEGAAGQAPAGLKPEIAALFPDRLVEVDGREVPEGWEVGSFLDVADLLSGGTPSTSNAEYWNGDIPWVSAKDVGGAKGSFLLQTEKTITPLGLQQSSTRIIPARTTIITARGTVGSYCLLGIEMAMNQTNYGLRARSGVGDYFVFFSIAEMIEHLRQHAYGTIFDTITTKTFRDTKTVRPSAPILEKFQDMTEPIMAKVLGNERQSRTLAALRDTLLPKLISGALRVADAERIVGRCV